LRLTSNDESAGKKHFEVIIKTDDDGQFQFRRVHSGKPEESAVNWREIAVALIEGESSR